MLIKALSILPMESGQCSAAVLCANQPRVSNVVVGFFWREVFGFWFLPCACSCELMIRAGCVWGSAAK